MQQSKADARKIRYARQGPPVSYQIGDHQHLLVRTHRLSSAVDKCIHKLFMHYKGPYTVSKIIKYNVYVLNDQATGRVSGTFNIVMLRPYLSLVANPRLSTCIQTSKQ